MNKVTTKKESIDREHICGCGKSYLSFAALSNHVKIKHKNTFPQNTISSQLNISLDQNIKKFCKFTTYGVNRKIHAFRNKIKNHNNKIIQDSDKYDFDFDQFLREQIRIYKKNSLIYIEDIEKTFQRLLQKERINSKDLKNIYEVLVYFVYDCKKNCSLQLLKDIFLFVYFLVLIFNVRGWFYYQKLYNIQKIPNVHYCSGGAIEILTMIINRFTTNLYPYLIDRIKDIDIQTTYLGLQKNQVENMLFLVQYFTEWLYLKGFVPQQLQLTFKVKKNNQASQQQSQVNKQLFK